MKLERLRARAETFLEEAEREWYEVVRDPAHRSGIGARLAAESDLFALSRISDVQRAVSQSTGLEERRARFLLAFLARGRARRAAATVLDRRFDFETMGALEVEGERLAPSSVAGRLAHVTDLAERRRVEEAWLAALGEEDPFLQDLLERQREVYDELGYGTLLVTCELLTETDLRALAREGARVIEETESELTELLDWFLPRAAGVDRARASAGDRFALWWAPPAPDLFGEPAALRGSTQLIAKSGIDPLAGGRVRLERRPQVRRTAGAVACTLHIPHSVIVLHSGARGLATHRAELAAFGEALHAGYTDPDLDLEFRWMGDEAVPLAWGALFGGLLFEDAFVRDRYGASAARLADHRRLSALLLLLRLRRRIGVLQATLAWCEDRGGQALLDNYPDILGAATGLRHDPRQATWDVGIPSDVATVLKAELLAAVLRDYLRERFDVDWYRNPRAGETIVHLMRDGRRYTASELAVQLASQPLSARPALDRIRELLA
jgi:hypothetical protein